MTLDTIEPFASLAFVGGLIWFFVSIFRTMRRSTRESAKRQVIYSTYVIIGAFAFILLVPMRSDPVASELEDVAVALPEGRREQAVELGADDDEDAMARIDEIAAAEREAAEQVAREAIEKKRTAHWDVRTGTSQLDDSLTVQLFTESTNIHRGRFGRSGRLRLAIICEENNTRAYVRFAGHFMADIQGRGRVDYRIDDNPARHRNFGVSNNNEALGLWRGGESIPWIREMFGGSTLYVRATPFSESQVSGEFNITGIEDVIEPLREACNW